MWKKKLKHSPICLIKIQIKYKNPDSSFSERVQFSEMAWLLSKLNNLWGTRNAVEPNWISDLLRNRHKLWPAWHQEGTGSVRILSRCQSVRRKARERATASLCAVSRVGKVGHGVGGGRVSLAGSQFTNSTFAIRYSCDLLYILKKEQNWPFACSHANKPCISASVQLYSCDKGCFKSWSLF